MTWHKRARCNKTSEPELFFPRSYTLESSERVRRIYCSTCPVRLECLEEGMEFEHGIWGGLLPDERANLQRARRRAS